MLSQGLDDVGYGDVGGVRNRWRRRAARRSLDAENSVLNERKVRVAQTVTAPPQLQERIAYLFAFTETLPRACTQAYGHYDFGNTCSMCQPWSKFVIFCGNNIGKQQVSTAAFMSGTGVEQGFLRCGILLQQTLGKAQWGGSALHRRVVPSCVCVNTWAGC